MDRFFKIPNSNHGVEYTTVHNLPFLILDSAVVATYLTQAIDSPGILGESLITNKITAIFPDTPDKPISCAMHAPPTTESRIIYWLDQHLHLLKSVTLSLLLYHFDMIAKIWLFATIIFSCEQPIMHNIVIVLA
jgi:hypothetical protein